MLKILSIIIPTYNMEKYLRKCLDSLVVSDENMKLLEVLVINDGSKDSSSQIAHEYESRFPNSFRIIDKENGNYGSCINRGLKEATGKYIKVLDADDSFNNDAFSTYLQTLTSIDVDLVLNDTFLVNEKDNVFETWTFNIQKGIFDFYNVKINPSMHCVTYRRENLIALNYKQTEGISYTDQQWVFTPLSIVKTSFYTNLPLYRYLVGREGQTVNPEIRKKNLNQRLKTLEDMIQQFEEYDQEKGKGYKWMENKLINQISSIYRLVIIEDKDDKNSLVINFDNNLKEQHNYLYREVESKLVLGSRIKHNYGIYWRKYHRLNKFHPIIIAFYIFKSVFK